MMRIAAFFLVLILAVSAAPLALSENGTSEEGQLDEAASEEQTANETAQEQEEANEEEEEAINEDDAVEEEQEEPANPDATEQETQVMLESKKGAEVRLLQLERAVLKAIVAGEVVAEYITEKGGDTSELDSILAEMELLKEEISGLDPAADDAVDSFVAAKKALRDLIKKFRETARPMLSGEDMDELHRLIQEAVSSDPDISSLNQQIRESLMGMNAERIRNMLQRMGTENEELVSAVAEGTATGAQVRAALKDAFQQMPPEDRKKAVKNIVENAQQNMDKAREKVRKAISENPEMMSRIKEMRAERLEQLKNIREERRQVLADRLKRIERDRIIAGSRLPGEQDERLMEREELLRERMLER